MFFVHFVWLMIWYNWSLSVCFSRNANAITSPASQMNKQPKICLKWRRVVFKISGAALAGTAANNIDPKVICIASNSMTEILILLACQ